MKFVRSNSFATLRAKRVLVTGVTGFVGGRVAQLACQYGSEVIGLSRGRRTQVAKPNDRLELIHCDLEDSVATAEVIRTVQPDVIHHLAGCSTMRDAAQSPLTAFEANVRGTWNLLEAVRISGRRTAVVAASTDAVYADSDLPLTEESPLDATGSTYATAKLAAEQVCRGYAKTHGLLVAIARCSNIYGGGDAEHSRIVPGAVRAVLDGSEPVIRGTGREIRDFVHVRDIARGLVLAADALLEGMESGAVFNFSSGRACSVLEMVQTIIRVCGSDVAPRILNQPSKTAPRKEISSAKAQRQIGWTASMSLEAGIAETLDWHRTLSPELQTLGTL